MTALPPPNLRFAAWSLLVLLGIMGSSLAHGAPAPDVLLMQREMIAPVVKIKTDTGSGSGVVVSSERYGSRCETLIVTNNHVIKGATGAVGVIAPIWRDSEIIGQAYVSADIVADDAGSDLALLRLARCVEAVADLAASDAPLYPAETVYAVGAGLDRLPFLTEGRMSLGSAVGPGGRSFLLHSALIIYGNSGGGLFRATTDGYELIGINSDMHSAPVDTPDGGTVGVPHMALAIPMRVVRAFLAGYRLQLA